MLLIFVALFLWRRWPLGLALAAAALAGGLVTGLPLWTTTQGGLVEPGSSVWRHLVEGGFIYIDPILIMATALLFMKVIEGNGLLASLSWLILARLGRRPALLAVLLAAFVAFPGTLTGLTTASVLTTGAIAAPPMLRMGMDRRRVGAFIALAALLGMVAPPVNLPVMIIGGGVDMPYLGFTLPLLLLSVPPLVLIALWLGWGPLRRGDPEAALAGLDPGPWQRHGWRLLLPVLLVLVLMGGPRLWPGHFPSLGLPLIFVLASLLGLRVGERLRPLDVARAALRQALPVMAILVGVGCFIQIMTVSGLRGGLVIAVLQLPEWAAWLGMLAGLPLFGAVSAFGSASVLGVPFLLAMLGRPEIWVGAGLSLLAALGDLMPPTALSGIFAAQVVDEPDYLRVLRVCLLPALAIGLWALALIYFGGPMADWLGGR
jgi:TRAP-type C4-dicarboxylate transport system permease large subunit